MNNNESRRQYYTTEELAMIDKTTKRVCRSGNFRWLVAGFTVLTLGICYIRNKYGKPIEPHQEQKPKKPASTTTKEKDDKKKK